MDHELILQLKRNLSLSAVYKKHHQNLFWFFTLVTVFSALILYLKNSQIYKSIYVGIFALVWYFTTISWVTFSDLLSHALFSSISSFIGKPSEFKIRGKILHIIVLDKAKQNSFKKFFLVVIAVIFIAIILWPILYTLFFGFRYVNKLFKIF